MTRPSPSPSLPSPVLPEHPWSPARQRRAWTYEPVRLLETGARTCGPTFRLSDPRIGVQVVTGDPELVAAAFRATSAGADTAPDNDVLTEVVGPDSVLTTGGARHRTTRRDTRSIIGRLTSPDALARIIDTALDGWRPGRRRLLGPLHALAVETLLTCVYGPLPAGIREPLVELLLADVRGNRSPRAFAGPAGPPAPWRLLAGARESLDALLAAARSAAGSRYAGDDRHLMTLLITGHETTAVAAAWTLERLARNPSSDPVGGVRLAVLEALRLRPVIPVLTRTLGVPLRCGDSALPAGTPIGLSPWLTHRDPRHYDEPELFRPERFAVTVPAAHLWYPFGGGSRKCLGDEFAVAVAAAMVRAVLRRFTLEPGYERDEPPVRRSIMVVPGDGVLVRLRRR